MVYPLDWIQETFPTRERAVELLRPELEDNVLTPHDYKLATWFLPGPNKHAPTLGALGLTSAVYAYGAHVARPRWTWLRLGLVGTAAAVIGSAYGTARILFAHRRFATSLEDPQAFMTALNHVNKRLGGPGNIASDDTVFAARSATRRDSSLLGHTQDAEPAPQEGWARDPLQDHANTEVDTSRSKPDEYKSKWEEIRAANSGSAGQSSWDSIRQSHERRRLPEFSSPSSGTAETDARAAAQADFDALLEAERRRGQSQDSREFV